MNKKTKGLLTVAAIGLGIYLLFRPKKSQSVGGTNTNTGGGSTGVGSTTTPGLNFIQMANDLFAAMDGCGTNWDDGAGDGITGILGKLKTQRDYTALNEAFGVRTVTCFWTRNITGNMETCLKSELDKTEIEEIKQLLMANGIQTQL